MAELTSILYSGCPPWKNERDGKIIFEYLQRCTVRMLSQRTAVERHHVGFMQVLNHHTVFVSRRRDDNVFVYHNEERPVNTMSDRQ
jgi:hypothetical protein